MARTLVLAVVALTLLAAPAAHADGDPASDVLPTQDAFYPYSPPASKPLVTALDALLAKVRKGGYPMKVALIESEADLGSYPTMFNNPQEYTNLLASELPTNPHGQSVTDELHLLVIMPGGFGGKNLGDKVDDALAPVKVDPADQTDGLVRAALKAVARIASANGVETPVPAEADPGGSGGDSNTVLLIVIGAVIVVLIVALVLVRRRARGSDERPEAGPDAQEDGEDARST